MSATLAPLGNWKYGGQRAMGVFPALSRFRAMSKFPTTIVDKVAW